VAVLGDGNGEDGFVIVALSLFHVYMVKLSSQLLSKLPTVLFTLLVKGVPSKPFGKPPEVKPPPARGHRRITLVLVQCIMLC
jgi:hypothetical protein